MGATYERTGYVAPKAICNLCSPGCVLLGISHSLHQVLPSGGKRRNAWKHHVSHQCSCELVLNLVNLPIGSTGTAPNSCRMSCCAWRRHDDRWCGSPLVSPCIRRERHGYALWCGVASLGIRPWRLDRACNGEPFNTSQAINASSVSNANAPPHDDRGATPSNVWFFLLARYQTFCLPPISAISQMNAG